MMFPRLDGQYQALITTLDYQNLSDTAVLPHCCIRPIQSKEFERAKLSPFAFQDIDHPQLLMNCARSFSETHIDYGLVSGFSTLIEGEKLFLSWPPTPANLQLFKAHHHFSNLWDTAFETIKKLENLHINHLRHDCIFTCGTASYGFFPQGFFSAWHLCSQPNVGRMGSGSKDVLILGRAH